MDEEGGVRERLERKLAEQDAELARRIGLPDAREMQKRAADCELEASIGPVDSEAAREALLRAGFDEYGVVGTLHGRGARVQWRSPSPLAAMWIEVELEPSERSTRVRVRNRGALRRPMVSGVWVMLGLLLVATSLYSLLPLIGFESDGFSNFTGVIGAAFSTLVFSYFAGAQSRERLRPVLDAFVVRLRAEERARAFGPVPEPRVDWLANSREGREPAGEHRPSNVGPETVSQGPYRHALDAQRATENELLHVSAAREDELAYLRVRGSIARGPIDWVIGGARVLEQVITLDEEQDARAIFALAERAFDVRGHVQSTPEGARWHGSVDLAEHHRVEVLVRSEGRRVELRSLSAMRWHLRFLFPLPVVAFAALLDGSHPIASLVCVVATLGTHALARTAYAPTTRLRALALHRFARALRERDGAFDGALDGARVWESRV